MPSTKRCRSVTHSIAHHALSGLSYVHPHLGDYCKQNGALNATINLLTPLESSISSSWPKPLKLASIALGDKFIELLGKEQIHDSQIDIAEIMFQFRNGRWPNSCLVNIHLKNGKTIECAIDRNGRPPEILHPS